MRSQTAIQLLPGSLCGDPTWKSSGFSRESAEGLLTGRQGSVKLTSTHSRRSTYCNLFPPSGKKEILQTDFTNQFQSNVLSHLSILCTCWLDVTDVLLYTTIVIMPVPTFMCYIGLCQLCGHTHRHTHQHLGRKQRQSPFQRAGTAIMVRCYSGLPSRRNEQVSSERNAGRQPWPQGLCWDPAPWPSWGPASSRQSAASEGARGGYTECDSSGGWT